MSYARELEIEAVSRWYEAEGRKPKYWQQSPIYHDQMDPTRERVALGCEAHSLLGSLERDEMEMARYIANGLHLSLKQLVSDMLGNGIVAHVARNKSRH